MNDMNTCEHDCYITGCKGKCESDKKKEETIPIMDVQGIDFDEVQYVLGILTGDE